MQEALERSKEEKIKSASELKNSNRLIKENILILKEKLKQENRQKKKLVEMRYSIIKNSIENYKELKLKYYRGLIESDRALLTNNNNTENKQKNK